MSSPKAASNSTRTLGLETEYAIRFERDGDGYRPSNHLVFRCLKRAISERVSTQPGSRRNAEDGRFFTESGASFCYESQPIAFDDGLIEAGTPECTSGSEVLVQQRAIDRLLTICLPRAAALLEAEGYSGSLGLLKNCRDAEGQVYGAQENYEVAIADGVGLILYRAALAVTLPFVVVSTVLVWSLTITFVLLALSLFLLALVVSIVVPPLRRWMFDLDARTQNRRLGQVARAVSHVDNVIGAPFFLVAYVPLGLLAFRRQRSALAGFVASRAIFCGAGTIDEDGRFGLSEKASAIRRMVRDWPSANNRPVFDTGNLLKDLFAINRMSFRRALQLFRARQRLQIGYADSNCAETAEFLRAGTTALLLDVEEAGGLSGAPQPVKPVDALHAISADPSLRHAVAMDSGQEWTALQIQRDLIRRAEEFVRDCASPSLEHKRVLDLWRDVIDRLDGDRHSLVGVVDWVTKRFVLDRAAKDAPYAVQKKIDLKYHELGSGYFHTLAESMGWPTLCDPEDVERAMTTPPAHGRARIRGQLIRELAKANHDDLRPTVEVSWDSVKVGKGVRGSVVSLEAFRQRLQKSSRDADE